LNVTVKNQENFTGKPRRAFYLQGFAPTPSGTTQCNETLAEGEKCTLSVTFTPPVTGALAGAYPCSNGGAINPVLYAASGKGSNYTRCPSVAWLFGLSDRANMDWVGVEEEAVLNLGGYSSEGECLFLRQAEGKRLGLRIGTNQDRSLGGFLKLSDAESVNFHCVPNQVLYQAEPLPDKPSGPLNTR
jgi:hypothetical protein